MEFANTMILVVDDQDLMRKTIKNILRNTGFSNIDEARDGLAAYNKIATGIYDLVISDWSMPNLTGIELLREARSNPQLEGLLFCFVTGQRDISHVKEAVRENVNGYITKPFTARVLADKILEILRSN